MTIGNDVRGGKRLQRPEGIHQSLYREGCCCGSCGSRGDIGKVVHVGKVVKVGTVRTHPFFLSLSLSLLADR